MEQTNNLSSFFWILLLSLVSILFQNSIISASSLPPSTTVSTNPQTTSQKNVKEISTPNTDGNNFILPNLSNNSLTRSSNNHNTIVENNNVLKIDISQYSRGDSDNDQLLSISWRLNSSYFSKSKPHDHDKKEYYIIVNNTKLFVDSFQIGYTLFENEILVKNKDGRHLSDIGMEFKSQVLSVDSRFLILHDITRTHAKKLDVMLKLCIYVVVKSNETETNLIENSRTLTKSCRDYWHLSDEAQEEKEKHLRKMVAGIGAGLVFLIPFSIVLFFIWKKDKEVRLSQGYGEVSDQYLNDGFDMEEGDGIKKHGLKQLSVQGHGKEVQGADGIGNGKHGLTGSL